MTTNNNSIQNLITNNFVKFNQTVLSHKLAQAKQDIIDDLDDTLVAEAATNLTEIRAVLALFTIAADKGIEVPASTTGIQLIEMVTGKTWRELAAPSVGERASQAASNGVNKLLGSANKLFTWAAEKTSK